MHDIRTLLGKLTIAANMRGMSDAARKLFLMTTALSRKNGKTIRQTIEGISALDTFCYDEANSWISTQDILEGNSGTFDVLDLRHWIAIAEQANVPYVPATEILSLTEEEINAIDHPIRIPPFIIKALQKILVKSFTKQEVLDALADKKPKASPDQDKIIERLYDAMDDVPYDAIVRSNLCGPSTLKTFAGAGVLGEDNTSWAEDKFDIEIGPGWIRQGNRRRVDATDSRFIDTFAEGSRPSIHYLARPWIKAARYQEGPDPHRHGTPFAGLGIWPCEWRVFVSHGRITGVANYYGWNGEANPLNARRALEAASLAQQMIDLSIAQGLSTHFMNIEINRHQIMAAKAAGQPIHESHLAFLEEYPIDDFSCTLDFIEAQRDDGSYQMMFLEGGPAHTKLGGGHPCAFAGHGTKQKSSFCDCTGVAFRLMDNVILADPKTWADGTDNGHILSWDDTKKLASQI